MESNVYYSRHFQDKWIVENVFPNLKNGFFVEVGCFDGIDYSNSLTLEKLGWSGICIDPFPTNFHDRTALVVQTALSATKGEVVKFKKAGLYGGIVEYLSHEKGIQSNDPVVELTTTTLTDVLKNCNSPNFIHYFSLDTEGTEYNILYSFDFQLYTFGAITVEHNFDAVKRHKIKHLLENNGYYLSKSYHVDDWYVHKSINVNY